MKVKELIKQLQGFNPDAHVHIQTDKRFEEDINNIEEYSGEGTVVVLLSSQGGWIKL
ncbi:hypothetical protein ACTHP3_05025 [Shouchella rhizosphaerae]|uniref:hypothetical protein n=1 Tax=Shouchella rhizosphaerae TaxID=866786 RepID=UPI003F813902